MNFNNISLTDSVTELSGKRKARKSKFSQIDRLEDRLTPQPKLTYILTDIDATLDIIRGQGMVAIVKNVDRAFNTAYTLHSTSSVQDNHRKFFIYNWDRHKSILYIYSAGYVRYPNDPKCCFKYKPFCEAKGNITNDYKFKVTHTDEYKLRTKTISYTDPEYSELVQ